MRQLRWRAPLVRWCALILIAIANSASGRPYVVEDLLKSEEYGRIAVSPDGRWLVFEKLIALEAAEDFDDRSLEVVRSRLYRVGLDRPGPAMPLLDRSLPGGAIMLGYSPQGTRLAIGRLVGETWRLGIVTLASGAVRWFDISPDYYPFRATLGWASETRAVLIARPRKELPWLLGSDRASQREQIRRWAEARRGHAATATVLGSGRQMGDTPDLPSVDLVTIDVQTGHQQVLATGAFQSVVVAPGGGHAAIIAETEPAVLSGARLISSATDPRHRSLSIVDLRTGATWVPCPACDVPFRTPTWSPSGQSLLFFGRQEGGWETGRVWQADVPRRHLHVADPGFRADVRTMPGNYAEVALGWSGEVPLAYGRRRGAIRDDWYRLDRDGPALTRQVARPTFNFVRGSGDAPVMVSGDEAWRLSGTGARRILARATAITSGPTLIMGGDAERGQAAVFGWNRSPAGLMVEAQGMHLVAHGEIAHARPVATSARNGSVIAMYNDANGECAIFVQQHQRSPLAVSRINRHLTEVDESPPIALHHLLPDGRTVTSWLMLPSGVAGVGRAPLVVIPYAGANYGAAPPTGWGAGSARTFTSAAMLRGHGYAVLLPSMPDLPASDHGFDFAGQVLAATDAAIATGRIDPNRLGLWGHSFGAYTTAMIVARTDRFRAAVVSNGLFDLTSFQGAFTPQFRLDPASNSGIAQWAGWTEMGQPHLGALAWTNPVRYVANSAVYQAGKIQTPMLIMAGDRDFAHLEQSEQLFSALYRQGKDAELVTYWGEAHVLASPENLRDCYRRVLAWLDDHFAARPPTAGGS